MAEVFLCPGCGKDMTDFMAHEAHYADEVEMRSQRFPDAPPWPWTDTRGSSERTGTVCSWTRDFLSAEWLRRSNFDPRITHE